MNKLLFSAAIFIALFCAVYSCGVFGKRQWDTKQVMTALNLVIWRQVCLCFGWIGTTFRQCGRIGQESGFSFASLFVWIWLLDPTLLEKLLKRSSQAICELKFVIHVSYEIKNKQNFDLANLPFSEYQKSKTNFASFPARASHSFLKRICILLFYRAAPQTVTVLTISSVSVRTPWRHAGDVSQLTRSLLHADASVWMDLNLMNLVSISFSQNMDWYIISHWLGVCSLASRPMQKPLNWQCQTI